MTGTILARTTMTGRQMLDHMGSNFRETDPGLWWRIPLVLSLLIVAILLVWLLATMERRSSERQNHAQPIRLYLACLFKLRAGWLNIWWMWRLAQTLKLADPVVLLISPTMFDDAVGQYCNETRWYNAGLRTRFSALRRRLFE